MIFRVRVHLLVGGHSNRTCVGSVIGVIDFMWQILIAWTSEEPVQQQQRPAHSSTEGERVGV